MYEFEFHTFVDGQVEIFNEIEDGLDIFALGIQIDFEFLDCDMIVRVVVGPIADNMIGDVIVNVLVGDPRTKDWLKGLLYSF